MPKGIYAREPRFCSIEGCEGRHVARGWCNAHYFRWKAHGDPLAGGPDEPRGRSVAERFWAKVDKNGPLPEYRPDLGPCWLWTASLTSAGYGQFAVVGEPRVAHCWAFVDAHGAIPEGLHLDHLCRVRACVNPAHLEPVTPRENILRGVGPAAVHARQTHCKRGHPFDIANTHLCRDGSRKCRICQREGNRRRAALRAHALHDRQSGEQAVEVASGVV